MIALLATLVVAVLTLAMFGRMAQLYDKLGRVPHASHGYVELQRKIRFAENSFAILTGVLIAMLMFTPEVRV